jgi:hypothetical protein
MKRILMLSLCAVVFMVQLAQAQTFVYNKTGEAEGSASASCSTNGTGSFSFSGTGDMFDSGSGQMSTVTLSATVSITLNRKTPQLLVKSISGSWFEDDPSFGTVSGSFSRSGTRGGDGYCRILDNVNYVGLTNVNGWDAFTPINIENRACAPFRAQADPDDFDLSTTSFRGTVCITGGGCDFTGTDANGATVTCKQGGWTAEWPGSN